MTNVHTVAANNITTLEPTGNAVCNHKTDHDGAIMTELQTALTHENLQETAQKVMAHIENIARFYSTKGKFDQDKRERYPLLDIIKNASQSPEQKISGIQERWNRVGRVLTEQQKQYILTMKHQEIFSRSAIEGGRLIQELMENGFTQEQAWDVCNNGECGIYNLRDKRKFEVGTLLYFGAAPFIENVKTQPRNFALYCLPVLYILIAGRNLSTAGSNEDDAGQQQEMRSFVNGIYATGLLSGFALVGKLYEQQDVDFSSFPAHEEALRMIVQKAITRTSQLPALSIASFNLALIICKYGMGNMLETVQKKAFGNRA